MALVRAVTSGDTQTLRQILSTNDVNINRRLDTGETLLHLAISQGHAGPVRVLLEHGADVNAATPSGEVPLHQASSKGLVDVVRGLYAQGADLEALTPRSGETNLHLATRGGHVDVVEFLLQHGAGINVMSRLRQTPLALAAGRAAGADIVRKLLDKGAVVNNDVPGMGGAEAPIHSAVRAGDPELVQMMLAAGADVNVSDRRGLFPLHVAAERGDVAVVRQLLRHSANTNCKSGLLDEVRPWIGERRHAPLHMAASHGHVGVVQLLLDGGAELDMPTTDFSSQEERPWCWIVHKETALHLAADGGYTELVRELARRGANLGNVDIEGNMPHHLALHASHHDTLHALLLRGCDINARDGDNKPGLHQAIRLSDSHSIILLIMHGASVSPRRKQAKSLVQMLASDQSSDPDLFPALYYSGNTTGQIIHQPEIELFDLKISPERHYIYEWLIGQDALVHPLKILCRWLIRKHFRSLTNTKSIWIFVANLPVPQPIRRFLLLEEYNKYPAEYEVCPVISRTNKFMFSASPISLGFNY